MQRKFLTFFILVSLAFSSCWDFSLPNRIELEIEGSVDLPVKIATSNWGSTLAESLQESFSEGMGDGIEVVEVYNVNYGQTIQAFCVYIPIEIPDILPDLDGIDLSNIGCDPVQIKESVDVPSFGDFTIECPIPSIDITIPIDSKFTFPIEIPISSDGSGTSLPDSISDYFLHAQIGKGSFTIDLDLSEGSVKLSKDQFDFIYNIKISQLPDNRVSLGTYSGLNYPVTTNPPNPASEERSLEGQHINTNPVKISGSVTLTPKQDGGNVTGEGNILAGHLKIKMNISEYKELDLDFEKVSIGLENLDPVSLKDAAEHLNYIRFPLNADVNGKREPGIGININFTKIINGLAMSIECDDLEFGHDAKPLQVGANVFGNTKPLELNLASYKNDDKKLQFKINLLPSGSNKNVLHLTNLTAGEELEIKGEANFFQHWVEAEVSVDDTFKGEFPDKDEDPIDLSSLNEYFEGFKFDAIEAAIYLSGLEMLDKPNMTIDAIYDANDTKKTVPIIAGNENNPIKFIEKQIVIADYLDDKGSYKKEGLPPNGNPFNFVEIINDRPKNLVFRYTLAAPTIKVTPDMLDNNESVLHDIRATIILLIHMSLTAEEDNIRMEFPGMFEEGEDLFGRESWEEDSIFTSLNVDYITFTVDFTSPFFTRAKLFIEKENPGESMLLFPDGIPVSGSKISFDIRNKELEIIRKKLIYPNFRLEFEKGGRITIPRTIGVTSIKIEAKGKTSVTLDL
jgi:hypothetical protein